MLNILKDELPDDLEYHKITYNIEDKEGNEKTVTSKFIKKKEVGEKKEIPDVLKKLLEERKKYKKAMQEEKDPFKKAIFDEMQMEYKIKANSLITVGSSFTPDHHIIISENSNQNEKFDIKNTDIIEI
jgi:DNA polymerase family B